MNGQHVATEQGSARFVANENWKLVRWKEWWRVGGSAALWITTRRFVERTPSVGERFVVKRAGLYWLMRVESIPDARGGELRNVTEVHARILVRTEDEAEVLP